MSPRRFLPRGILSQRFRSALMAVSCAAIAVLVDQTRLGSQSSCTHLPSEGNLTTIDGFVESILACKEDDIQSLDNWVPDGGFVKVGTTQNIVKLHTRAETSGKCTLRAMQGIPSQCLPIAGSQPQLRTVNKVTIYEDPPTLLPTNHYVFGQGPNGTVFRQILDTRDPGTTNGPVSRILTEIGRWLFKYQSTVNTTSCNIQPSVSTVLERSFNVLACEPKWWRLGNPPYRTIHSAGPTIYLYINPSMWNGLGGPNGSATQAANDWNTLLAGTGITIQVVDYDCGTGGNCVNLSEDYGAPPGTCAEVIRGNADLNTGVLLNPSLIRLRSYWRQADPQWNRRTIAHELGHILGLDEYEKEAKVCEALNSIMAPPEFPADPSTWCKVMPAKTSASPTKNDGLPTASSTYGNNVHKICGF